MAGGAAVVPESNTTITIRGSEDANASSISFLGNGDTVSGGTLDLGDNGGTIDVEGTSATISSTIVGGGLTETGSGTDLLTATNAYNGPTIVAAGTLEDQSPGALSGYDSPSQVSVASGATLAVMVGGSSDWNSDSIGALLANATFASGSLLGIDTSDATSGPFVCTTNIADSGGGALNLNLVKLGNNTLTLAPSEGNNNYSGTTTVIAGTLETHSPAALPGYNVSGQVSVDSGATLAVMVGTAYDWGGMGGDDIGTLLDNASFADGATLGIDTSDADGGTFSYPGSITNTSGGSLAVAVCGGGTLELSGTSTYSGPTAVIGGTTLQMTTADALPSTTVVTLTGSSLNLNGNALTIAGLAGDQPSSVNLGGTQLTLQTSANENLQRDSQQRLRRRRLAVDRLGLGSAGPRPGQ